MFYLTKKSYMKWYYQWVRVRTFEFARHLHFTEQELIVKCLARPWRFYVFQFRDYWLYFQDGKLHFKKLSRVYDYGWCRDRD